eukprot:PRCOL_00006171-RA
MRARALVGEVKAEVEAGGRSASVGAAAVSTDEAVWPEPLTASERIRRAASFWGALAPVLARYQWLQTREELASVADVKGTGADFSDDWEALHEDSAVRIRETLERLQGFYVKSGQLVSTRVDLFPPAFARELAAMQDSVPPMDPALARAVVERELLETPRTGVRLEDAFSEFDDEPVGSASVAQVHRAVLAGSGREVAVKVQRPAVEPKMLGDVGNLTSLFGLPFLREAFPVDYYVVFSELGAQLVQEFDFTIEARNQEIIRGRLGKDPATGRPRVSPVRVPAVVDGMVAPRCMVMDFVRGVPLSRAGEEMAKRGIEPGSPESKLFGRKLLSSLTQAFGCMILEDGLFHADPHPGNIFIDEDGACALLDFGQTKQLSETTRRALARLVLLVAEQPDDVADVDTEAIATLIKSIGVTFVDGADEVAGAAAAMWLFDSRPELPGGYDASELSANSPALAIASFPREMVFVGRSTVLIRGITARLGLSWSLARQWAPIARRVLEEGASTEAAAPAAPRWIEPVLAALSRLAAALRARAAAALAAALRRAPPPLRRALASLAVRLNLSATAALRDMYLELERAEAGAEAREIACVAAATNAAQAAACTAEYLDAADAVEGARLAAAAAGASTGGERAAANAAVMEVNKAARARVAAAQERELACIEHGGGAECTVAFLADADAAEADARDAVRRYRNILRRWVSVHGSP